jgi:hypothetical protein
MERSGLVFSGLSPDSRLVEYVELPPETHPFYVGTQAHPELRSRPTRPHPLFREFVGAATALADARDRAQAVPAAREREPARNGADHHRPVHVRGDGEPEPEAGAEARPTPTDPVPAGEPGRP